MATRNVFLVLACALFLAAFAVPSRAGESREITELKQRAEQGDREAQFLLGAAFDSGHRLKANPSEAARWYRMAAEQGHAEAENSLGSLYLSGAGVAQDNNEAFRWFKSSSQHRSARGTGNLAYMYDSGLGVKRDQEYAVKLYEWAANAGDVQSMYNVGVSYKLGQGIPIDGARAYMWLDLARLYTQVGHANRRVKWAVRNELDDLEKGLSANARAEGKRRAEEWDHANRAKVQQVGMYGSN